MKKNNVIGMVLIFIIMVWWMFSMPAPEPVKQEPATKKQAVETQEQSTLEIPQKDSFAELFLGKTPSLEPVQAKAVEDTTKDSLAEAPFVVVPHELEVETERFVVTLSNQGAKIKSIIVKDLADSTGKFPEIIQDSTQGALSLSFDGVNLDKALFSFKDSLANKITVEDSLTVAFTFTDPSGKKIHRLYSFTKEGSAISQKNIVEGFRVSSYRLSLNGGMRETEAFPEGKSFGANYFFSEVIFNNTFGVEREMITAKETFNQESGKILWAGLRRKYIAMTVQFANPTSAVVEAEPLKEKVAESDPGTFKLSLSDDMHSDTLAFDFMVLPLEWAAIKQYDVGYEKIIVSGWQWCGADTWFVAICGFLLWLLKAFYSIIPNYGVAIILLTILVRLLTTPLTLKQLRSSKDMAKLKPELDAINVKYRSDPQKRQAAIMELYAKNKINPLASCTGGCFPLLLQMPIFFGLFIILGRAIELRGQPFIGWISDLSHSDVIFSGISIPFIMPHGIAILPLIMVVTTYFQTKQSMSAMTDPAQQKMMTWMMPGMMFLFSAVMPSGLVLYWIISNIWGIVQYRIINPSKPAEKDKKKSKGKRVVDAEIISTKKK